MSIPSLLVGALGCDAPTTIADAPDAPDASFVPAYAYDEPGPWEAGTYAAEFTGSAGVELEVQVWYPTADTDAQMVTYDGLWPGEALEGAAPDCAVARPVVAFSHGYGAVRWQSPEIVEHLATHGYVVVAPDHTANTFFDNDDSRFEELVERRPVDLADSFDWAGEEGALSGCVDASAGYAAAGHSFGGYTAFVAAGATIDLPTDSDVDVSDPRVWATIPLAPWDASGVLSDGTSRVEVPVMTLSGLLDETTPWAMVSALHGALAVDPRYLGAFATAGHFSFSPVACALGTVGNGCGEQNIDPEMFLGLVNTSILAFLESIRTHPDAIGYRSPEGDALAWTAVP